MKRYNQGFAKFGPMEQCDDGEWVKYEDVVNYTDTLREEYQACVDELNDDRWNLLIKAHDYWFLSGMFGVISLIEFGIILFK